MHNALLVARLSLQEATRKRLVAVLLVLSALFLSFYLFGVYKHHLAFVQRAAEAGLENRSQSSAAQLPVMYMAAFGMYLVFFLSVMMSVLSTVGSVSADIENGVMQSVIARPIRRAELVLGRWLGFMAVNIGYVSLLSLGVLGGVYLITGYHPPEPLQGVALLWVAVILITALTVAGSTLLSTLANGIGVFVLYGAGFAGGIMSAIGEFSRSPTLVTLGKVANYLMPTNELWLGASYHFQGELMRNVSEMGMPNPFFGGASISPVMLLWSLVYAALALALAMWQMTKRDL